MSSLILITGTGRSGTSTMSGTLHHLGLSVPGPYLVTNESNPRGFFESQWAVDFHRDLIARAGINEFDGNPTALERARAAVQPDDHDAVLQYLTEHQAEEQLVLKDPRTVWTQQLWRECAADAEREVRFISMLRHPAEVIGSRTTYYTKNTEPDARRRYQTISLGRWINSSIINERETRGLPRCWVMYTDLLADWRPVAQRLQDGLGLRYAYSLEPGELTPVDTFIEPSLRRHAPSWEGIDVPAPLQEIADGVWQAVVTLGGRGGVDDDASAALDALGREYAALYESSSNLASDVAQQARAVGRREGIRRGRRRARQAAQRRAAQAPPTINDARARQLLVELGGRLFRRS